MANKQITSYTTSEGTEVAKVQVKAWVPVPLALKVKTLLLDPKTGSTEYGSQSALITRLLSDWVESMRINPETENVRSPSDG